jgi:hypothetical protein
MFLIKHIIPIYFFSALLIGIIISVLWTPEPTIIYKYPTPYNKIVFKDKTDLCYQYVPTETECNDKTISVKVNKLEDVEQT